MLLNTDYGIVSTLAPVKGATDQILAIASDHLVSTLAPVKGAT